MYTLAALHGHTSGTGTISLSAVLQLPGRQSPDPNMCDLSLCALVIHVRMPSLSKAVGVTGDSIFPLCLCAQNISLPLRLQAVASKSCVIATQVSMDSPLPKRKTGVMWSRQSTSACNPELVHTRQAEKTEIARQTYAVTGWARYLTGFLASCFSVGQVLEIRRRGRRQSATINSKHLSSLFLETGVMGPVPLEPEDLHVNQVTPGMSSQPCVLGFFIPLCTS